jgi:hypothetical protein
MHNRLQDIVYKYLGQPLVVPDGYKYMNHNNKNTSEGGGSVEIYSGSLKFNDLEQFTTTFCIDLQLRGLGGTGFDCLQIYHLLYNLKGEAKNLLLHHMMSMSRTRQNWALEDAFIHLYNHFVQATSTQEARENLDAITYDSNTGVQSLFDNMMDQASNMATHPNEYSLIEKFLARVPDSMVHKLMMVKRLSPDVHTINDFLAFTVSYKSRQKMHKYYQKFWKHSTTGVDNYKRNFSELEATKEYMSLSNSSQYSPPMPPTTRLDALTASGSCHHNQFQADSLAQSSGLPSCSQSLSSHTTG